MFEHLLTCSAEAMWKILVFLYLYIKLFWVLCGTRSCLRCVIQLSLSVHDTIIQFSYLLTYSVTTLAPFLRLFASWCKMYRFRWTVMEKSPQTADLNTLYAKVQKDLSGSDRLNRHCANSFGKGFNVTDVHLNLTDPDCRFNLELAGMMLSCSWWCEVNGNAHCICVMILVAMAGSSEGFKWTRGSFYPQDYFLCSWAYVPPYRRHRRDEPTWPSSVSLSCPPSLWCNTTWILGDILPHSVSVILINLFTKMDECCQQTPK